LGEKVGQVAGHLAKQAAKQLLRQGLRWLAATLGPVGILAAIALLAVIGFFYGLPLSAHNADTDSVSRRQQALWRSSEAAAQAAMPKVRSYDRAELNWPVDPGWLAALDKLVAQAGRPVDLGAWAKALAPRFTYRPSTVVTVTTVCGQKCVTTTATRKVEILLTADTAVGRAVRTYRRRTLTTVSTPTVTVTVTEDVPVSTSWTADDRRLRSVANVALGRTLGARSWSAYIDAAAAWDDPLSGLIGLLGPGSGGFGGALGGTVSGDTLANVLTWQREIVSASRTAGIRGVALVDAIVAAESGGDPTAVSPAGAEGLMQVMPGTAATLGIYDLFDAAANLRAGTEHLAWLLNEYGFAGTCWPARGQPVSQPCLLPLMKAVAAYNAGEGAVDRYGGVPPYPETQHYVLEVLRYYDAFRARLAAASAA
jgi:soluble lytic murein transglycosylase-like protein